MLGSQAKHVDAISPNRVVSATVHHIKILFDSIVTLTNMMRFPSSVASLAAKRILSNSNAAPAAFARFGAMRMMSAAPSVKVRKEKTLLEDYRIAFWKMIT